LINWSSRGLKGSLPSEIGVLSKLERLILGKNQLTGTLPESLSQLSLLEHLEVNRNELVGSLPDVIWSNMRALKRLLVQSNRFDGTLPPSLCELESLHSLDLFENSFEGSLPECFGSMTLLKTLHIHGTQLVGTIPPELCRDVSCDTIACPMHTFAEPSGRETESSNCLACPAAMYLGSIHCPDTAPPIETEAPSTAPTDDMSAVHEDALGNWTETPSSSPSETPSFSPTESPSLVPWNESTLGPMNPPAPGQFWIVPPPPVSASVYDRTSFAPTPNWTLLSIACLLSSLAMLAVVWSRRSKRENHHYSSGCWPPHRVWRRRGYPQYLFPAIGIARSGMAQRTISGGAAVSTTTSQHSRTRLLPLRERSFSMPSSLSCCRRDGISPTDQVCCIESLPQKPQKPQHEQQATLEEDVSIESDSGWNDTESSGDDNDSINHAGRLEEWNDPWAIHYGSSYDLTE
jgi:hypothetical protein